MMSLSERGNPYSGINAHLHSALQSKGGAWESFHSAHIGHLTEALDARLPPGYYALNEKSLQLSLIDLESGLERRSPTRPDIAIYERGGGGFRQQAGSSPTLTLPLTATLVEDEPLRAVVIINARHQPVTRIELLSPANKPGGSHAPQYRLKRGETLKSGVALLELDYLHESPPVIPGVGAYSDGDGPPYMIMVSNPRPSWEVGITAVYGFFVDQPCPTLDIPLLDGEFITLDFNAVYQTTFASNRYYHIVIVDYDQLPARFEMYQPDDQARIRAVMTK
jgi:hypothetical protein